MTMSSKGQAQNLAVWIVVGILALFAFNQGLFDNFTGVAGAGTGDGAAASSLFAVGATCISDAQCGTGICDLDSRTDTKGTCVSADELCGNNFCDLERGESVNSCASDCGLGNQLGNLELSPIFTGLIFISIFGIIFLQTNPEQFKKFNIKKFFGGKNG